MILFYFEVPSSLHVLHRRPPHRVCSFIVEYKGMFYGLWMKCGQWKENRKYSSLFLLTLKCLSKDPAQRFLLFCVTVFCLWALLFKILPCFFCDLAWWGIHGWYKGTWFLLFLWWHLRVLGLFVFPVIVKVRNVLKVVDLGSSGYKWRTWKSHS